VDSRIDKEERAYLLLQWASLAPLAPFDQELAESGFYTAVQGQRSDQALDAWDKENPFEQGTELKAFHELERKGVFTQSDFFSPDKAAGCIRWIDAKDPSKGQHTTCNTYTQDLNAFNKRTERIQPNSQTSRRTVSTGDRQGITPIKGSRRRRN
jgi:hypothetical protein